MGFSAKYMSKSYFKALMKEVTETDQKIAKDEKYHKLFMEVQTEAFNLINGCSSSSKVFG